MLRAWKTPFHLDPAATETRHQQIADRLTADILAGRLLPGEALPGSRELARQLRVNRKTVALAYADLLAQGWLEARPARGTFVANRLPVPAPIGFTTENLEPPGNAPGFSWHDPTAPDWFPPPSPVGTLTFTDGTPDGRLAPAAALATAYRRVLLARGRRNQLGYDSPAGFQPLRAALSAMLNHDRGLHTTPETICLTRGTQMALYLTARLLLRPGDVVAVENPGYPPAWHTFRLLGAEPVAVPVDTDGLDVHALDALCAARPVRALYLTPHHQFPTTATLPPARRRALLAVAARHGLAVIEDDYDHEFHYAHQPLLPLASADTAGLVIYLGSLSKLLAPALRIGYVTGPPAFVAALARLRSLIDHQGDTVLEQALTELIGEGELKRHTRRAHAEYQVRRDALADQLHQHLGDFVDFRLPEGGLAIWATFRAPLDLDRVARHLATRQVGITPGSRYFLETPAADALRLGFAALTPAEIGRGIAELGRAVRAVGTP